ncbi:MAG TPA: hypothetical protein VLK59_10785, partial [Solirubrobacteraceae bacterium]|nr:hypothetical protein [Solirubrobacteraceae bacterium]
GETWTVADTAIPSTPSGGIFALAFRNAKHGLAVGGDFATPDVAPDATALTSDRGKTWDLVADAPTGYRSGATWRTDKVALAVGVTGSDYSSDRGHTWQPIDSGSFDTVDCSDDGDCWASGELGRIARLVVSH